MAWQKLVTCALLGTERQAPPVPTGDNALGQLLGQLDGDDREGLLLRAVGVMALWRCAGYVTAHDERPLPPPCVPTLFLVAVRWRANTLPCCCRVTMRIVAGMADGVECG
ncbi:MAG: hypothetical protein U1F42_06105 [Candidatus Competibacteraceae bacterium]